MDLPVVEKGPEKLNIPEPFVTKDCPLEPSALGSVNVKFEAILSAAFNAT
jgi:hypothetical protein